MSNPVEPLYIEAINSFRKECANFFSEFEELHSEDFTDFVKLWKKYKFTLLYERYTKYGNQNFFKEDSLQIVKTFMLKEHFVGGLFLLYGLFFVQENPKQYVRLELEEFKLIIDKIKGTNTSAFNKHQLKVIFAKLLRRDAFNFTMFSREFVVEGMHRSRLVHFQHHTFTLEERQPFCGKTWMDNFLTESGLGGKLKAIDKNMSLLKSKYKIEHPDEELGLDLVPDDFMAGLQETFESRRSSDSDEESIGLRRRKLKNRRMEIKHRYQRTRIYRQDKQLGRPQGTLDVRPRKTKGPKKCRKGQKIIGRPRKRTAYHNSITNTVSEKESDCENLEVGAVEESSADVQPGCSLQSQAKESSIDDQPGCSFNLPDLS